MAPRDDEARAALTPAAGGGLLDRRLFLGRGLALGGAALLGGSGAWAQAPEAGVPMEHAPPWMRQPGGGFSNYGQPSPHESGVVRWISANARAPGNGVAWAPLHQLAGTLTPSGLHFERHHNGVPAIDPARHRLLVHGLVRRPLAWGVEDLLRYRFVSRQLFIECGGNSNSGWQQRPVQGPAGYLHGLASCSEWAGVPLAELLEEAGVDPRARWVIAEGADAVAMNVSIPLAKLMDDAFVALYQNGERIRPGNGYPLRLIVPGWEGVLNVKWLRRLQLSDRPAMTRNETARYTELLPSGEALQFSFVMQAKSVITQPFLGQVLPAPGVYRISGLAWSGRGRIARVEVSADGGRSWAEAALAEPVQPQCFTRFDIPWRWDGGEQVLMSRAVDETGYVQPARARLLAERGRQGYFHYNAIVAWAVGADGRLRHVYA